MKRTLKIILLIVLFQIFGCGTTNIEEEQNFEHIEVSEAIKDIIELKNQRKSNQITKYLSHQDAKVREFAILSIASIGKKEYFKNIKEYLTDENEKVRIAAAYALGVLKNKEAETYLITAYSKESSTEVKKQILESIGFCGTDYGLQFLCSIKSENQDIKEGIAWGLVRFSQRNIISRQAIEKALEILETSEPYSSLKQIISFYFTANYNFQGHINSLISAYENAQNKIVKANLILAIGKTQHKTGLTQIINTLTNCETPEVLVNAIKGAENFNYYKTKNLIYNLLYSSNSAVSKAAADFFIKKGIPQDVNLYLKASKEVLDWETRVKITYAVLKHTNRKKEITNSIITGFEATNNIYEKAEILKILSIYPPSYKFIFNVLDTANTSIIRTSAVEALWLMFKNPKFDYYSRVIQQKTGDNLYNEFFLIFKNLISTSNDNAIIYFSAKFFSDNKIIKYINDNFENTHFLTQGLSFISLPRDIKTYQQLCKALKKVNNYNCPTKIKLKWDVPNWQMLEHYPQTLYIKIITTKGNIIVQLNTQYPLNELAKFLELINEGYYENKFIRKAVENQAVYFGGKRGDGWESDNLAFINDLYPNHFEEGYLAFDNLGMNFSSGIWFITTYPTVNFDGKYTILGKVIKGMDIVKRLAPNDKIFSIEILDNPSKLHNIF